MSFKIGEGISPAGVARTEASAARTPRATSAASHYDQPCIARSSADREQSSVIEA